MTRPLALAAPLLLLGLALFARNQAGWIDPLIDFGRELYVPWRITEGEVLYRDIRYLDGPLPPYLNALWFTLLPVSIRTLEWLNGAILAISAALLFALLRRLGGTLVAFASVAVFLSMSAFNLIGKGGNMNWVAPYSHGATHGVALALLGLWLLARHLRVRSLASLAAAGGAIGLCGLTKPEVFAAAVAAVLVGVVAGGAGRPAGEGRIARDLAVLVGFATLPLVVASGLLALAMPAGDALRGALGGWPHLVGSTVPDLHFYRWLMGIDDPGESLRRMGTQAGIWTLGLAPGLAVALAMRREGRARRILAVALPVAALLLGLLASADLDWGETPRPLTLFVALFVGYAARNAWRARGGPDAPRAALQLAFSVLALALLAKILLQPVLWGYGFALAVPAMALLVLALLHSLPAGIDRLGGHGGLFRGVSLALLAVACLGCLRLSERERVKKTLDLAPGDERLLADGSLGSSKMVARLVGWIDESLPPDASLVVLPEGVMVNYLTRRVNPTPHLNFVPPEIALFGEDRILQDLRRHPPDYVVLVQRDTEEYGLPLFGSDYAPRLLDWARHEHEFVTRVGAVPLQRQRLHDGRYGFEVWRRPGASPPTP